MNSVMFLLLLLLLIIGSAITRMVYRTTIYLSSTPPSIRKDNSLIKSTQDNITTVSTTTSTSFAGANKETNRLLLPLIPLFPEIPCHCPCLLVPPTTAHPSSSNLFPVNNLQIYIPTEVC